MKATPLIRFAVVMMIAYSVGHEIINPPGGHSEMEFDFIPRILSNFIALTFLIYHLMQGVMEWSGKYLKAGILRFFAIVYGAIQISGQIFIFFFTDKLSWLPVLFGIFYLITLTYLLVKDIMLMRSPYRS